LQRDLGLAYRPEHWDEVKLAAWLCRNLPEASVTHASKLAFVAKWLRELLARPGYELARTNRQKFLVRNLLEQRMRELRLLAVKQAFQKTLFDEGRESRVKVDDTLSASSSIRKPADLAAVWLTLKLAAVTTTLLLVIGTPLAWWLARTRSWWKGPVGGGGGPAHRAAAHGHRLLPAGGDGAERAGGPVHPGPGPGLAALHLRRPGGGLGVLFPALRGAALAERLRGHRRAAPGSGRHPARLAPGRLLQRRRAPGPPRLTSPPACWVSPTPWGSSAWC
jgi:hypothetical protein